MKINTSNNHFIVSAIKSGLRIAAGFTLVFGNLAGAGWLLVIAEILGVVEEVV